MLNMVLPLVTNNSKYWNDNPQQKKADDEKKGDYIKKLSPHWSKRNFIVIYNHNESKSNTILVTVKWTSV